MLGKIEVRLAECHDTCLDIEGPDGHVANVSPIGETNPQLWRVDCDKCGTRIRSGIVTKAAAKVEAMRHVLETPEEFFAMRERNKRRLSTL